MKSDAMLDLKKAICLGGEHDFNMEIKKDYFGRWVPRMKVIEFKEPDTIHDTNKTTDLESYIKDLHKKHRKEFRDQKFKNLKKRIFPTKQLQ